jgi:hypothetical protein
MSERGHHRGGRGGGRGGGEHRGGRGGRGLSFPYAFPISFAQTPAIIEMMKEQAGTSPNGQILYSRP